MAKIKEETKMVHITIRIPVPLKEWIEEQAEKEQVPYTVMIRVLLDRLKYEDEIRKELYRKSGK